MGKPWSILCEYLGWKWCCYNEVWLYPVGHFRKQHLMYNVAQNANCICSRRYQWYDMGFVIVLQTMIVIQITEFLLKSYAVARYKHYPGTYGKCGGLWLWQMTRGGVIGVVIPPLFVLVNRKEWLSGCGVVPNKVVLLVYHQTTHWPIFQLIMA